MNMKKITIICLILLFIFSLIACAPKSNDDTNTNLNGDTKPDLYYTLLEDDTYGVSGIQNLKEKDVIIPPIHKGKNVTQIIYFGKSNLESIVLPDTIIKIGSSAFNGCQNLYSINLPNSIEEIGNNAFMFCRSLTDICIPNNISILNKGTFHMCTSLENINIGEGVKIIDDMAFYNCAKIESIYIPNNIVVIGKQAFFNCLSLRTVYIDNKSAWDEIAFMDKYSNPMVYAQFLTIKNA